MQAEQGLLDMTWLNIWGKYDSPLPLPQLTNLANALNIIYHKLDQDIGNKGEAENLDLVIIANGSVGAPQGSDVAFPAVAKTLTLPSNWMYATDRLSSVTFYAPWGTQIDPSMFYGIITGDIEPDETRILGLDTESSRKNRHPGVPKELPCFNTISSSTAGGITLPTVWCNSFEEGDPVLEQLTLLLECDKDKSKRPYVWWRLGSMPAYMLAALAGIAAMMLSSSGKARRVDVHFAQCLVWPNSRRAPPKALGQVRQYYNVVEETFKTPCCFTITPP